MKETFTFFDIAHIHVQGHEALLLTERCENFAEYNLIGFRQIVTIKDFRYQSLVAIDHFIETNRTSHFPDHFNTPAYVNMNVRSPYDIQIKLFDTHEVDPDYCLWVNIGCNEGVPVYNYLYKRIQAMDNDQFAFLALYLRFPIQIQKKRYFHNSLKQELTYFSSSPVLSLE